MTIIQQQREYFHQHFTKDVNFRKQQLKKLSELLKKYNEEIKTAVYQDFKKSEFDILTTEIAPLQESIHYYLKNLHRLAQPKKCKRDVKTILAQPSIIYEPLGVTLIIGAWNYPFLLCLAPLIASMSAGNTAIVKPSEIAPHCAAVMKKIINENFPTEYISVIEGGVETTTELLAQKFDKIFYTGSSRVGKIVYQAAAQHLTPVCLELGGKSPTIITPSANIDIATKRIVWGKFLNAGQTCIAPDYILVHQSIHQEFIKSLIKRLKSFDYKDNSSEYCQIINDKNLNRLINLIDEKKVIYGGNYNAQNRYLSPTILDNVNWEDKIMEDEIFGPLLPIIQYENFNEIIDKINQQEKPLAAYLFSDNQSEINQFKNQLSFGGGCINDIMMHITSEYLPFGGVGKSGIGSYHGEHGFKEFSHQKSVLKNTTWGEPNFKFPPYTPKKLNWLKRIFRMK
ncbi:MAG: aldehyde dehydrogenase [Flavobacteriales bacterium]|nr:MAG: aldehyde dehydrogenase [Flavobacteriales bacterium]